jgi:hypothetical protein
LIRSKVMAAAMARSLSPKDGVAAYQMGSSSELRNATLASPFATPGSQPELKTYLRQLYTLHAAGILTDAEFQAASGRLLGS